MYSGAVLACVAAYVHDFATMIKSRLGVESHHKYRSTMIIIMLGIVRCYFVTRERQYPADSGYRHVKCIHLKDDPANTACRCPKAVAMTGMQSQKVT